MKYDTAQKREVLKTLQESPVALSAHEVASRIEDVGLSTVYRLLSQLKEEGLAAEQLSGRVRTFSYLGGCSHHLHASCGSCGALIHLDEDTSRRIQAILKEKGLELASDCLIPCICPECQERRKA